MLQVPAASRIGAGGKGDARRALRKRRDTQQQRGTHQDQTIFQGVQLG